MLGLYTQFVKFISAANLSVAQNWLVLDGSCVGKKTIIFKFSYLFFVICTSQLTKDLLFSLNCLFLLQTFFIYLAFLQCCSFLGFHFSFLQLASYRNRVPGKDTDMTRILFSDKDTLFRRQGCSVQDYHLQYL